jgi:hypothetical protein
MVLKGQRRQAASELSESAKINRIARTTALTTPAPTSGLVSQAEQLAIRLQTLFEFGQRIAGEFHVDTEAVWTDMLERSRGQRR